MAEEISLQDACEWNPVCDREATNRDRIHARAEVLVGKDGVWRLCRSCAELERFKQYKVRRELAEVEAEEAAAEAALARPCAMSGVELAS